VPLEVAALPPLSSQEPWQQRVNAKDVHVLAAALAIDAGYLLTLDQRLVAEVNQASLPVHALTPDDFIRLILPSHVNYPSLRS
jgi:predicted nucleic acid-binding protein